MTTLPIPPLRILILGVLGSVVVIIAAYSGVVALWRPADLDAFLPVDGTAISFHRVSTEDRRHWSDLFPSLRDIPMLSPTMDIGIARTSNASATAWIASPAPYRAFKEANAQFGRQAILLSPEGKSMFLDPQIGAPENVRLRSSRNYRALTRGLRDDASWIYVAEVNAGSALPARWKDVLRGFGAPQGPLLVFRQGSTTALRFTGALLPTGDAIPSSIAVLSPASEMSIAVGSARETWERSLARMLPDRRAMWEGAAAKEAERLLGGEWSARFDLLPLIGGRGTLHVSPLQTGGTRILFDGIASSSAGVEQRLAAFHEQFRASALGTAVVQRTLEPGTVVRVIQSDPDQMEDTTTEQRGWTVRVTRERVGGRMLMSAQKGNRFLIGNDQDWMEQITATPQTALLPQLRKPLIAGGTMSRQRFNTLSEGMLPPLRAMLTASLDHATQILWSLEADGDVLTISLSPQN